MAWPPSHFTHCGNLSALLARNSKLYIVCLSRTVLTGCAKSLLNTVFLFCTPKVFRPLDLVDFLPGKPEDLLTVQIYVSKKEMYKTETDKSIIMDIRVGFYCHTYSS